MNTLLTSIKAKLKANLSYLKWVDVVPDELLFPEEPGFPMIGLVDNGIEVINDQLGARREKLKVKVAVYQAIRKDVSASVMGDGRNKGVLAIAVDVKDQLRNELFEHAFYVMNIIAESGTRALTDLKDFTVYKVVEMEWRREVAQ